MRRKDKKLYVGLVVVVFFVGLSNFFIPTEKPPMKFRKVANHSQGAHAGQKRRTAQEETPEKPTMFVLTTGRREFKEPPWAKIVYIHGSQWPEAIGKTYDEGWGKQKWPEGAKRVSEGFVTIWKLVSNCSGYCFVSEDDAIWPWGEPPPLPKQGFVSFFKEAVCDQATVDHSDNFKKVYKSVVPGKCMPYGAVAHAMTPEFATTLLERLPMEVPVDHYLWKQAVSTGQGYVSQRYIVYHKKGPSLRKEVNTRPQKPLVPPALVPPAFTLLQSEGNHRKFDKPWSNYNKFITDKGFLKLGTDNVAHEFMYWSVAKALNLKDIFTSPVRTISMCKDATDLTDQLTSPPSIKVPLYGIFNAYKPNMKSGWGEMDHCKDIKSTRVLKMLLVDYLMGHSDRPSNCHTIDGKVYAIDNDGITITPKLKDWNNDIQENILHKALKDEHKKKRIIKTLEPWLGLPLNMKGIVQNMKETFHCSTEMHEHIEKLGTSILTRYKKLARRQAAYCILFTAERMQYALGKYDVLKKSGIDPKDIHLFMGDKFPVGRHKPDLSNIHIADRKLSLTGAYTWMMTSVLESYENAVIIEDDLQLAADFVEYMEWGMKLMDKSSNIFSVSAWNDNSWNYLKLDKEVFMMTKQFMGLGWLVNRRSLPLILNALSNECTPWDLCVHREMSSKGMVSVYPQYARVYHMPWKKGRHFHLTQQVQYSHDVKYPNVDTFLQYEKYICQLDATLTDLTSERIHKHISPKNIYIKSALSHDYYGIYDGIVLFADAKGQQHVFTNRKDLCNRPRPAAKIAVAIPTYNRAGYVKLCSQALAHSLPMEDVWIFDDHSSDYGATELAEWFLTPNICVNEKRLHPDGNARKIMEWFLSTDYDWLVTLDSDLIVRSDWLTILKTLLPKTQGVISVYHSGNPNHKTLSCDQDLCEMESLGNAGITWSKSLAKEMLTEMKDVHGYDWGWTAWLQKKHIKQYVPKDSLVLHIGMHGTWGVDSQREKSLRFAARKLDPDINKIAQKYLKGHSP